MLSLSVLFSHPDRCGLQPTNLRVSYRAKNQVCLRIRLAFGIGFLEDLVLPQLVRLAGVAVSVESPGEPRRSQARRSRGSAVRQ